MAGEYFVDDGNILWIARQKVGTPAAWQSGTVYNLGDVVVPSAPQPGQENLMFQAVGFIGISGSVQPTWATTIGNETLDNQVEWRCHGSADNPAELAYNEYYLITETVTVS